MESRGGMPLLTPAFSGKEERREELVFPTVEAAAPVGGAIDEDEEELEFEELFLFPLDPESTTDAADALPTASTPRSAMPANEPPP